MSRDNAHDDVSRLSVPSMFPRAGRGASRLLCKLFRQCAKYASYGSFPSLHVGCVRRAGQLVISELQRPSAHSCIGKLKRSERLRTTMPTETSETVLDSR